MHWSTRWEGDSVGYIGISPSFQTTIAWCYTYEPYPDHLNITWDYSLHYPLHNEWKSDWTEQNLRFWGMGAPSLCSTRSEADAKRIQCLLFWFLHCLCYDYMENKAVAKEEIKQQRMKSSSINFISSITLISSKSSNSTNEYMFLWSTQLVLAGFRWKTAKPPGVYLQKRIFR